MSLHKSSRGTCGSISVPRRLRDVIGALGASFSLGGPPQVMLKHSGLDSPLGEPPRVSRDTRGSSSLFGNLHEAIVALGSLSSSFEKPCQIAEASTRPSWHSGLLTFFRSHVKPCGDHLHLRTAGSGLPLGSCATTRSEHFPYLLPTTPRILLFFASVGCNRASRTSPIPPAMPSICFDRAKQDGNQSNPSSSSVRSIQTNPSRVVSEHTRTASREEERRKTHQQ